MNIEYLVKMANQIEAFFKAQTNRDLAIDGVADHIKRFWDPRMRQQIKAHVDTGGEGLGEIAIEAVKRLLN